jgi:hypothetical protein
MVLLLQVLGVLAGALVISAFVRGDSRGLRPDPPAIAIVAAIAGCILFWGQAWSVGSELNGERKHLAATRAFDAFVAPGVSQGQNVRFLEWARKRMPRGDTFAIMPADMWQQADMFIPYQWSTYQLSPHRSVAPQDADWLVFYGTAPEALDYDRRAFDPPVKYGPGFALARRHDAG